MITKIVKYKNHTYTVVYSYIQARDFALTRKNKIDIIKIDNITNKEDLYYEWTDSKYHRESIIGNLKDMIDNYIESKTKEFSYEDKFDSWNGNLDNWVE